MQFGTALLICGYLVDGHQTNLTPSNFQAGKTTVADDGKPPRLGIAAYKRIRRTHRAHKGILHRIRGIGFIAKKPAREIVGGVEVTNRQIANDALLGRDDHGSLSRAKHYEATCGHAPLPS